MRVGSIAVGRSGDKGATLDLTLVAVDAHAYRHLERGVTVEAAQSAIAKVMPGKVERYAVPGLNALKFVITDALPDGVYATLHAGLHWQKAAIWVLLDLEIEETTAARS